MRVAGAKLFALLAVLLLLLPGGVSAHAQYYCQMTGQVVAACCCGVEISARASRSTTTRAECRVADCCQRISSSSLAASPGVQQALQHVATAAPLVRAACRVPRRCAGRSTRCLR